MGPTLDARMEQSNWFVNVFGTVFKFLRATRLDPMEALRYE